MKKNRIAAVAVAALVAGTLAACSSGTGPNLGGGDDAGLGPMVIPVNQSPWLNAYKKIFAKYTDETGVKIELREFPNDQLRTQYITDQQQGKHTFDLYEIGEENTGEFFDNGWVQPLTDIDPKFALDPEVISYSNLVRWDKKKKVNSSDGALMGVPLNGNVSLYMYRADVLKNLNIATPKTWDDVIAAGKKAMSAGAIKYGYTMRLQGVPSGSAITFDFEPLFYTYGGSWFAKEGTDWTPTVDSPAGVAAATTMRELAKLGPAETTTLGQSQIIALMQAGESLQTHLAAAGAANLEDPNSSNVAGKMGYALMPSAPGGKPAAVSGVFVLGVPTGLSDARSKRALAFLKWFESEKVQTEFGKAGGIPTRTDSLKAKGYSDATSKYFAVLAEQAQYVRPHIRYTFVADLLAASETILPQIAAGTISPKDGMALLQEKWTAVIKKAGLPMSNG